MVLGATTVWFKVWRMNRTCLKILTTHLTILILYYKATVSLLSKVFLEFRYWPCLNLKIYFLYIMIEMHVFIDCQNHLNTTDLSREDKRIAYFDRSYLAQRLIQFWHKY